jgi:hypothetical protein
VCSGDFLSNILESMGATEESYETCSVGLDSAWSPRVILAVAGDEDQSLGAQSDRRGRANTGTGSFTHW